MDVDTNEQWCCIAKSKIGHRRLYMGGEIDCVEGESIWPFRLGESIDLQHFTAGQWRNSLADCVELKTNMLIRDSKGQTNFER
jgi:RAT1-interacting protein